MLKERIAIYARISVEDIDKKSNKAKDESNSIASQKAYINRYLDNHPSMCFLERIEFSDDGFSGTNFQRPGFTQMIEMIKRGEIAHVIVKDLSRFGRDYIEVGDYLEHIFPFLGIRFISINDNYDSAQHSGVTVGADIVLKNLVYDYYCKDLSIKVKSAMTIQQKQCRLVNCVPYGYKPSPYDKHQLVIDPPAADIVRRIFLSVISGFSPTEIARALNEDNIQTPSQYKAQKKSANNEDKGSQWTHRTIHNILNNIKYSGTMVNHTRESRHIRDRNQRRVPKEEWHMKEGAHEGIVTEEEFEQAHNSIKKRGKRKFTSHECFDRVYYCAYCGRKLEKENNTVFACPSRRYHCNSQCDQVYLRKSDIEIKIEKIFHERMKPLSEIIHDETTIACSTDSSSSSDMVKITKRLESISIEKMSLYEQYKSGSISKEDYIWQKSIVANEESRIKALIMKASSHADIVSDHRRRADTFEHQKDMKQIMYESIQRVVVKSANEICIEWK